MIRFFTYGTFRNGECRHYILQQFSPTFLGIYSTAPQYTLYNLGSFPGMHDVGEDTIVGELYEIPESALPLFDQIEGHPSFFIRKDILLADNSTATAYIFPQKIHDDSKIKTGNWLNR